MPSFTPSASIDTLKKRARVLRAIRAFFEFRDVWEVDVPILGRSTVTDIHIESLSVLCSDQPLYLQTSPEFFMKRLLASGSGSIFYLGKAFRDDEMGACHRAEFTMLEWYRVGLNERQLMDEVAALVSSLNDSLKVVSVTYAELFETFCGLNPHDASLEDLYQCARSKLDIDWDDDDRNVWLDLLFTHIVEPKLDPCALTFVTEYPATQSALAALGQSADGHAIARRFEVFWRGMELANGYFELTDAHEQQARFEADVEARHLLGKPSINPDTCLLEALESSLPSCAGVALGVDRLLMCLFGEADIAKVMPFANG